MKTNAKIEKLKKAMIQAEEVWEKINESPDVSVEGCHLFDNKKIKEACWKKYTAAEAAYYKELSKKEKR